ncbi:probable galactinol--sucrose galactosyltransferase 1 [Medicago truncatula]|uniref:probable galactinol--sucrose galactosyltransferase 1 n=1 Tax=Medicago truncatula TaxID=3880 RepID=UPI001967C3EB|nr:probable galactinol--sucrose galactosyltransferase 1 [Medicago truncatula]
MVSEPIQDLLAPHYWTSELKSLTIKCAEQVLEIKSSKALIEKLQEENQELEFVLEMYGLEDHQKKCLIIESLKFCPSKPGNHDFNLLKKLVLPDGSTLRAKLLGRPTKDCLFSDPARDGKSLLKIWNMNDYSGVVGVFNCQGAGWCKVGKKNLIHDENPGTVTDIIRAKDIDHLSTVADDKWTGDAIIFSHLCGEVVYLPKDVSIPITMKSGEYEVFTFYDSNYQMVPNVLLLV